MKSPHEKARELVDQVYQRFPLQMHVIKKEGELSWEYDNWKESINCSIMTVNEIIESRKDDSKFDDTLYSTSSEYYTPHPMYITYWQLVKMELESMRAT